MALTVTLDAGSPKRQGRRHVSTGTILFDASYPTNGEAITLAQLGFVKEVDALIFVGGDAASKRLSWDKTNSKVLVYLEGAAVFAEQGNGTDPGISAARFYAVGW